MVDCFAAYVYLPRLASPEVLLGAIKAGLALLTWTSDSFAFADSLDEAGGVMRASGGAEHLSHGRQPRAAGNA
ncbi:MAG: hypothetical protein NUW01_06010 [Gemmatimonadaceae bacterium]|nr:hypothetical protein [Gemmatimonadaceae bacterium]